MKDLWRCIATQVISRVVRGRSAGTVLAKTMTLCLGSALLYRVAASWLQRPAAHRAASSLPPSEWWRDANDHPILALLAIVLAVSAYAHSQRFVAVGLSILAATLRDAREANEQVAASFDEVIRAFNEWARRRGTPPGSAPEERHDAVDAERRADDVPIDDAARGASAASTSDQSDRVPPA